MSLATLMVQVDAQRESDARIALAADLAKRFHASLIGISGWAPGPPVTYDGVVTPTQEDLDEMRAVLDRRGEQFRAVAKSQVQDVEWRSALEFPTEFVAREARAADLVVVGGDSESGSEYESLNRAALILKAGRPILTVPNGVQSLRAKCIAVAWKETREARRALADALPFLVEAEGVFLVEVAESGAADEAQRHLGDIARYLGRHGINAIAERVRPFEVDVSSVLFRLAKDENIDLVVAGGYGHSRLGEWMFGGVTRELLGSSPVCCLFSH